MTRITSVELSSFRFEVEGLGLPGHGAAGVGNLIAKKGERFPAQRWAVRVETDEGARGEYVTHSVGTPSSLGQATMLAPHLVGRDPDPREEIWQDLRREIRAYDHMGHGPLDIALWDLAGKRRNVSVARLLGGFRSRLPIYASTYHGQDEPGGLDTPQAFADYAAEPASNEASPASRCTAGIPATSTARSRPSSRPQGRGRRLAPDARSCLADQNVA